MKIEYNLHTDNIVKLTIADLLKLILKGRLSERGTTVVLREKNE